MAFLVLIFVQVVLYGPNDTTSESDISRVKINAIITGIVFLISVTTQMIVSFMFSNKMTTDL